MKLQKILFMVCFIFLTQSGVFASGKIINDFGICYDPEAKTFGMELKMSRYYHLKGEGIHELGWRINGGFGRDMVASEITRINRYYYSAQVNWSKNNKDMGKMILFHYTLDRLNRKGARQYGGMRFDAEMITKTVGDFLMLDRDESGFNGFEFHEGKPWKITQSTVWEFECHQWGKNNYLFALNNPFVSYTGRTYFSCEPEAEMVKQVPLIFVYSTWNQIAYGSTSDKEDPLEPFRCFYNLRTGEMTRLDNEVAEDIAEALIVNENEIVTFSWCDEKMVQTIRDGQFRQKAVSYQYHRCCNVLIKEEKDHFRQILNSAGACLVELDSGEDAITRISLDQDVHEQTEALIGRKGKQQVLVDCIGEAVHYADEIEHVGLGFFRLTTNGKEEWVTL